MDPITVVAAVILRDGRYLICQRPLGKRHGGLWEFPGGKLHDGAYDVNIVGVDPDYRVHVRRNVLEEHDGPMLRHGLQELDGIRIHLPRVPAQRPRADYLDERFARFRAA